MINVPEVSNSNSENSQISWSSCAISRHATGSVKIYTLLLSVENTSIYENGQPTRQSSHYLNLTGGSIEVSAVQKNRQAVNPGIKLEQPTLNRSAFTLPITYSKSKIIFGGKQKTCAHQRYLEPRIGSTMVSLQPHALEKCGLCKTTYLLLGQSC